MQPTVFLPINAQNNWAGGENNGYADIIDWSNDDNGIETLIVTKSTTNNDLRTIKAPESRSEVFTTHDISLRTTEIFSGSQSLSETILVPDTTLLSMGDGFDSGFASTYIETTDLLSLSTAPSEPATSTDFDSLILSDRVETISTTSLLISSTPTTFSTLTTFLSTPSTAVSTRTTSTIFSSSFFSELSTITSSNTPSSITSVSYPSSLSTSSVPTSDVSDISSISTSTTSMITLSTFGTTSLTSTVSITTSTDSPETTRTISSSSLSSSATGSTTPISTNTPSFTSTSVSTTASSASITSSSVISTSSSTVIISSSSSTSSSTLGMTQTSLLSSVSSGESDGSSGNNGWTNYDYPGSDGIFKFSINSLTYTPFNNDLSNWCRTSEEVSQDLESISRKGIKEIRVYGTDCNSIWTILPVASNLGIKVIQGFYINSAGVDVIDEYIDDFINWTNTPKSSGGGGGDLSFISAINIGNEVIYNRWGTSDQLKNKITEVRAKLLAEIGYSGPIVTSDIPQTYIEYPELCDSSLVDFIGVNAHPYFDPSRYANESYQFMIDQIEVVTNACGGQGTVAPIRILESGYPHNGDVYGNQIPSFYNQGIAVTQIYNALQGDVVLFAMWDDYWKDPGLHNVEWYFGLFSRLP